MMSPDQPRQAPPLGRVLRILLGLVLMAYAVPVYFQVPLRVAVGSSLLMLGLLAFYSLILVSSRRLTLFSTWLGAVLAIGVLVPVCAAGASRAPLLCGW